MNLEFAGDFVPAPLYEELAFSEYLHLFDADIPVLSARLLWPMLKEEGLAHFKKLAHMESVLDDEDVVDLFNLSRQLPGLERILPAYRAQRLEQYHFFELGRFLDAEQSLAACERKFSVARPDRSFLAEMRKILQAATRDRYSAMRGGEEMDRLRARIESTEELLQKYLQTHAERIFIETGLKMSYPWPRELLESPSPAISKCPLLNVKKEGEIWLAEHNLDAPGIALLKQRDELVTRFEDLTARLLVGLNNRLSLYFDRFSAYYAGCQRRAYRYLLLAVKVANGLSLPRFTSATGCSMRRAVMPVLEKGGNGCVPLDLDLGRGASVLFGPHMSGKTTVLKSLYFFLTLVRAGLPVPADVLRLNYPEAVAIMLRSSGDMQRQLSSFGEELTFLAGEVKPGAYLLVDELFLSTDPLNGAELSEIFISYFAARDMVFFCTTHYPTVLDIDTIALFRMLDGGYTGPGQKHNVSTGADIYRIKRIENGAEKERLRVNSRPLEIALRFPLSEEIKKEIRRKLKNKME